MVRSIRVVFYPLTKTLLHFPAFPSLLLDFICGSGTHGRKAHSYCHSCNQLGKIELLVSLGIITAEMVNSKKKTAAKGICKGCTLNV